MKPESLTEFCIGQGLARASTTLTIQEVLDLARGVKSDRLILRDKLIKLKRELQICVQ